MLKPGWPADTTSAGESPEVRGLAAADLDGDGLIEVVATTTQTQTPQTAARRSSSSPPTAASSSRPG